LVISSDPTPSLTLSNIINVTLYMEAVPPNSVKSINITFGYYKPDETFVTIGSNTTIKSADLNPYVVIQFVTKEENRSVEKGSRFSLIIEVTFENQPYGTFKVYFGKKGNKETISKIELFD
ncbi:MAG: hypothetical protein QW341_04020, partial [Candidatus Bathyarchaeia archaeon]